MPESSSGPGLLPYVPVTTRRVSSPGPGLLLPCIPVPGLQLSSHPTHATEHDHLWYGGPVTSNVLYFAESLDVTQPWTERNSKKGETVSGSLVSPALGQQSAELSLQDSVSPLLGPQKKYHSQGLRTSTRRSARVVRKQGRLGRRLDQKWTRRQDPRMNQSKGAT